MLAIALFIGLYLFAGWHISQLINLVYRERDQPEADNQWTIMVIWLPAALYVTFDTWRQKQILMRELKAVLKQSQSFSKQTSCLSVAPESDDNQ